MQCDNKLIDTHQTQQVKPNYRVPLPGRPVMNDPYTQGLPACKSSVLFCFVSWKNPARHCTLCVLPVRLMCCQTFKNGRRRRRKKKWVERTCLTRQVNVFMWKTGTERREMWKSEPAGNISPGKLMRDKYLHTDVTTHSRTKEQHTAMAFPERAHKDQPLTRGNEQSFWVAPCYPGLKRPR